MKTIKTILVLSTILLLCGCNSGSSINGYSETNNVWIHTDKDSGCQYLVYKNGNAGGITPRMKSDGTQYCEVIE